MIPLKGLFIALCSFVLTAAPALALQPPRQQDEFVPISQLPPGDRMPAAPLVIVAYAFVWIALMGYLWSIWRRIGKIEADLRTLERRSG
jgi:CcmD family protein